MHGRSMKKLAGRFGVESPVGLPSVAGLTRQLEMWLSFFQTELAELLLPELKNLPGEVAGAAGSEKKFPERSPGRREKRENRRPEPVLGMAPPT